QLSGLETVWIFLPAILCGMNYFVIVSCALFIHIKIKHGTHSQKMRSTQKRRLLILGVQSLNPFFFNFLVSLFYEIALIAPVPGFIVTYIPLSCFHPSLNALIILSLTTEHRRFIAKIFTRNQISST
ncbi:hypothetical protein PMAYCL1PPCAC_32802, partial [Pristionchus mayeri]